MTDQEGNESSPADVEKNDASRRSWTIIAVIAVAIFIGLAALMTLYLLRDSSEQEAAPAATDSPTEVTESSDEVWSNIQERGAIIIGTAADYPPFEFYDQDFQLDGLDIAIIREIGRRLGLEVEVRDMVFDGLINALRVDQIDAAISAITVTDQRRSLVDFSDIYFVSADALLASKDATFESIPEPSALTGLRLGVERGTIYESWAETNLVEIGIVPAADVFEYERMGDALADLRAGRIDIVALDRQPAEVAQDGGDLRIVAQGFNRQDFGIAVPQGASVLLARINETLRAMEVDGTLRRLAAEYTGLSEEAVQPLPSVEPTSPSDVATSPGGCIDSSLYISDLSYDDQALTVFPELLPGEAFRKGWRLRNSGTCTWTRSYALVSSGGDRMAGEPVLLGEPVEPGQEIDLWVDLVAPIAPGEFVGYWSMRNDQSGLLFGDRLSVAIEVIQPPVPTPLPTQTPAPGITFSASPEMIQQGQCTNLNWTTQNVQSVYLYEQGEDWRVNEVPASGVLTVCPPVTTTYELRAVLSDGTVVIRNVTVSVTPNTAVPQITRFTVDPPDLITTGQCVTIRWTVEGAVSSVNIGRSGVMIWPNAPFGGSMQDCPPSLGQQFYTIAATGPGGTSQAAWTISVVQASTAVPTSTPPVAGGTPTPGHEPLIYYFQAQPSSIPRNNCVTLSWSAGGNATRIRLVKNSVTIQDNLPFRSSWNDCSNSNIGTIIYLLVAQSNFNQTVTEQADVNVTP